MATTKLLSCERKNKVVFASEKAARAAARKMRRTAIDWFRLDTYYCEFHKGWHVGNKREGK